MVGGDDALHGTFESNGIEVWAEKSLFQSQLMVTKNSLSQHIILKTIACCFLYRVAVLRVIANRINAVPALSTDAFQNCQRWQNAL